MPSQSNSNGTYFQFCGFQILHNVRRFGMYSLAIHRCSFLMCRMLVPNKMQHTICTGNIGVEQYNELLALSPNVHVAAGNHDDPSLEFPETQVLQVGQFRIGVVHGHQILPYGSSEALVRWRRKLGVEILITGFTHQNEVQMQDGYYHINPVRKLMCA